MEGLLKFLGGGRVLKAKILEAKYEAKMGYPGGQGCKKNLLWGEYGYFLELHIASAVIQSKFKISHLNYIEVITSSQNNTKPRIHL